MAEYESLLARQQRIMPRAATRSTAPQGRQRPTQRQIFEPAFFKVPRQNDYGAGESGAHSKFVSRLQPRDELRRERDREE
jgi:hypothetical protein